jgi:hypothetical protein
MKVESFGISQNWLDLINLISSSIDFIDMIVISMKF